MGWKKRYYQAKEQELRSQGIKYIRYTKNGVPLPDWDKILQEKFKEIETKKKKEELLERSYARKELLENILYKGQRKVMFKMRDIENISYEVFNILYDKKVYFVIKANGKVVKWQEV